MRNLKIIEYWEGFNGALGAFRFEHLNMIERNYGPAFSDTVPTFAFM